MDKATYKMYIDWNNDGDFGDSYEDVSDDLIQFDCRSGRDGASQLKGRASPGRLMAVLKNRDGKYSSYNTSSVIYGSIKPGRLVRVGISSPATATLWTGYLENILPSGSIDGIPVAVCIASGGLKKVASRDIRPIKYSSQTSGALIGIILDEAGWSSALRDIDTGQTTIGKWFVDRKQALNAIRDIEDTELGFIYESLS